MAKKKIDSVIVLGGGFDSLVAAARLAKAGKKVTLLEAGPRLGGDVATDEIADGLRAPAAWSEMGDVSPKLISDLNLKSHGLELLTSRGGTLVPRGDDAEALYVSASGEPSVDSDAFADFAKFYGRLAGAMEPVWTKPLPALEPRGVGDFLSLINHGLRLRRLGKNDMPEAMRYLPMPIEDVLEERFTDQALMAAIAAPALTSTWLSPRAAGSALTLLHRRPAWFGGLLAAPVFAKGGPGALSDAVASAARAAGADLRTEAAASSIRLGDDGSVVGVALEDGSSLDADAVVSGLDPKATLLRLTDTTWLDPEHVFMTQSIRQRGTVAIVQLGVDALPNFAGAPAGEEALAGRIVIGPSLGHQERAFNPVKYGEIPEEPMLQITVPSLTDPSLASEGRHVLHVWTQWVPYRLAEGDWEGRRDELGDVVVRTIEKYAPGFGESVVARRVRTPVDLEVDCGAPGGCLDHAEIALDQMLFMRPMPGWFGHASPIEGLWLCGPSNHPGGGVGGLCGSNAAAALLG